MKERFRLQFREIKKVKNGMKKYKTETWVKQKQKQLCEQKFSLIFTKINPKNNVVTMLVLHKLDKSF